MSENREAEAHQLTCPDCGLVYEEHLKMKAMGSCRDEYNWTAHRASGDTAKEVIVKHVTKAELDANVAEVMGECKPVTASAKCPKCGSSEIEFDDLFRVECRNCKRVWPRDAGELDSLNDFAQFFTGATELPGAEELPSTVPPVGIERQLLDDFEVWYTAKPYKGASKDTLFKDWMWINLKEARSKTGATELPGAEELARAAWAIDFPHWDWDGPRLDDEGRKYRVERAKLHLAALAALSGERKV